MPRRFYKHRLLLDEGFPPRSYFPLLNHLYDVKHIKQDLKQVGLPDEQVFAWAVQEKRLVVTYNTKDFIDMAATSKDTGVIGVSPVMPYAQVDKKLTSLLRRSTQNALKGKYTLLK